MNLQHLTIAAIMTLLAVTAAAAETPHPDHLRCREIAGAPAPRFAGDLRTALGVDADCVIHGGVRELCEPVYDAASELAADAPGNTTHPSERLCYKVTCPARAGGEAIIADRFGTRQVTVGKPKRLCVSAPSN